MTTDNSSIFEGSSTATSFLSDYQLYSFPEGDLNGPVVDLAGKSVYYVSTIRNERGLLDHTTITRSSAIGSPVAQIRWAKEKVVGGTSKAAVPFKTILQRKMAVPTSKYYFQSDNKDVFYWKEERCLTPEKRLVARYTREQKGPFSAAPEQPATLLMADSYTSSSSADLILITSVMMEMKRKQSERVVSPGASFLSHDVEKIANINTTPELRRASPAFMRDLEGAVSSHHVTVLDHKDPLSAFSTAFVTYTFVEDDLNGPLKNASGRVVYILKTDQGMLTTKSTRICRPAHGEKNEPAAEIHWGGLTKSKRVIINGKEIEKFLKEIRTGLFTPSEWWFSDEDGNEYYWKALECFTSSHRRVATYTRQERRFFSTNKTPATLSVDPRYSTPAGLDFILVSALMAEMKRKNGEKVGI
ncbi:hypothetical protein FRB90_002529 [Tulasnella sp. 427]|nr:hypothetical protein FRB90_002529 [Tulasnella sp. 427]